MSFGDAAAARSAFIVAGKIEALAVMRHMPDRIVRNRRVPRQSEDELLRHGRKSTAPDVLGAISGRWHTSQNRYGHLATIAIACSRRISHTRRVAVLVCRPPLRSHNHETCLATRKVCLHRTASMMRDRSSHPSHA